MAEPTSQVLYEGWLWKRAVTNPLPIWRRRWVRVRSDSLALHRPTRRWAPAGEGDIEQAASRVLSFDTSSILRYPSRGNRQLRLASGHVVLILQADNAAAAEEWVYYVARALSAAQHASRTATELTTPAACQPRRSMAAVGSTVLAVRSRSTSSSSSGSGSGSNGAVEIAPCGEIEASPGDMQAAAGSCTGLRGRGGGGGGGGGGEPRVSRAPPAETARIWPRQLRALPAVWRLAAASARRVSAAFRPTEVCALCCEEVAQRRCHSNGCGHRCCEACWRNYLSVDVPASCARMRHARAYTLRCPWAPGCEAPLDRALLERFGPPPLVATASALEYRNELIQRANATGFRWLECPAAGCVGVGYDDGVQRAAMCFVCEQHFEVPSRGLLQQAGQTLYTWLVSWWPERIDGVTGWRPCPHCGAAILKDGGCDNMRCGLCQKTFRWGRVRNSVDGVVEAHAPPPRPPQIARPAPARWTLWGD